MRVDDQRAWNAACRRAGIEDFRFHDLRHTWASWLIQSGVPLSVLQEMGGWESIEMVRRYAHLAPNHLTEHAKQIDSIFSDDVPNMSHMENKEGIKKRNALIYSGAPCRIRTCDPRLRRPLLYPTELRAPCEVKTSCRRNARIIRSGTPESMAFVLVAD